MRKLLLSILLCAPMAASAEYLDVIEFQLNDGCAFGEYMEIVNDFNDNWGKANAYASQVAMPLQNDNLVSMYWLGRTENAAAFGKAWDTWRDELGDPESTASKLWVRFQACSTNLSRTGYDLY